MNKFRSKLLKKIAQNVGTTGSTGVAGSTGTNTNGTVSTVIGPVSAVPAILFSQLATGYNGPTLKIIVNLTQQLNAALHYASGGKDNFQKIIDNNLDLSGALPDEKSVGGLAKKVYSTFLNSRNSFSKKVPPTTIAGWANNLINSPEFMNLAQVNPTGTLATKLSGNLKDIIFDLMTQIKQQNSITN